MSSMDDGELRAVRCFSPMTASSPHGKDGNEMGAGGGLTDSFHGATHSERSDDPSTESRMCTEESIERMTSSTEGMVSLSDDSEDTHAEAHGVTDQARAAGRVVGERSVPWNSCRGASAANNHEGATSSMVSGGGGVAAAAASVAGHSSNLVVRDDTVEADEQSDEQMMNGLLGSYREISLEDDDVDEHGRLKEGRLKSSGSADAGGDTEEEVSNLSPDSVLPSPPYVDEQLESGVIADFEVDADVRSADMELSEVPNQRPNSLQLMSSSVAGGGARSKRPPSSSSSGTSPGRLGRCYHHELSSSSRPLAERTVASSTTCAAFSTSAPTLPPTTLMRSSLPPGISSSSPPSVSSSSDLEGMYGALQGLQGLILREGDMVSFVAEDLQEQIRRSSPVTRRGDTPSFPGSRSSSPSLYKQAVTPQVMPIDPTVLSEVEKQARAVSASVSTILENLTGTLHSVSSLTVDCMESYHDSVCKTCDSMDSNIKAMYQLMAKIEELGNMMRPVQRLSSQIKEIKRLLDLLEHVATTGGS